MRDSPATAINRLPTEAAQTGRAGLVEDVAPSAISLQAGLTEERMFAERIVLHNRYFALVRDAIPSDHRRNVVPAPGLERHLYQRVTCLDCSPFHRHGSRDLRLADHIG